MRSNLRFNLVLVVLILGVAGSVQAVPPSAKNAVSVLARAQGDSLQEALDILRATDDLLVHHGSDLKRLVSEHARDPDVAARVLALALDAKKGGCDFIAGLVHPKNTALVGFVLERFPTLPRCAALNDSVAEILKWAPDPEASAGNELMVQQVLTVVKEGKNPVGGAKACRFVLSGPKRIRMSAIETLIASEPSNGESCLVQAYNEEADRKVRDSADEKGDSEIRRAILKALAHFGGIDAVPTLIRALDFEWDRDLACEKLKSTGEAGINGMVFALRTSGARAEGVRKCLIGSGEAPSARMLAMLDHPNPALVDFAVEYFCAVRPVGALQSLKKRYLDETGSLDRRELARILVSYPPVDVGDVLSAALFDDDHNIRLMALDAVDDGVDDVGAKKLVGMAEEDPEPEIRATALKTCMRLGIADVVPLAKRMVEYERPEVAVTAIEVLSLMGDGDAMAEIKKRLGSSDKTLDEAAVKALWLMTYTDPKGKEKGRFVEIPSQPSFDYKTSHVCNDFTLRIPGKPGRGPLVLVLPGGPAMDLSWARPFLDDLADSALLAYVEPTKVDDPKFTGIFGPEDLECAISATGHKRAILLSHGVGGLGALYLSNLRPESVAGVVTISAPLTGGISAMDLALLSALPDPFGPVAKQIIDRLDNFSGPSANNYLHRLFVPAWAPNLENPAEFLRINVDVDRYRTAKAVLGEPEVRFVPVELQGKALFLLPREALPESVVSTYLGLTADYPSKVVVGELPACGFMPQISCKKKTLRVISDFIKGLD